MGLEPESVSQGVTADFCHLLCGYLQAKDLTPGDRRLLECQMGTLPPVSR